MKLRLNLHLQDLAYRTQVSVGTVSNIFHRWLDAMNIHLRFLIAWPRKEIVLHNMSPLFQELYPSTRCITDCTEIFIERPTNLDARAKTFSNYKSHNTVKCLIGITPNGSISYVSECWGGHVSDP